MAPWPGSSALLALPTLPCALRPLLSHAQPGRVRGWGRLGCPAREAHWLLQTEVAALTSRLAGLSKALTSSVGQSRAGEERQNRAGASDALPFSGSLEDRDSPGTCAHPFTLQTFKGTPWGQVLVEEGEV